MDSSLGIQCVKFHRNEKKKTIMPTVLSNPFMTEIITLSRMTINYSNGIKKDTTYLRQQDTIDNQNNCVQIVDMLVRSLNLLGELYTVFWKAPLRKAQLLTDPF